MSFSQVKSALRKNEQKENVMPIDFYEKKEDWHIQLNQLVLYEDPNNQEENFFPYQATHDLDFVSYAELLKGGLKTAYPKADIEVVVRPQFKTLPIPLLNIPIKIPFTNIGWRKGPNKVRGNEELASIPAQVSITIKNGSTAGITGDDLWENLNRIACVVPRCNGSTPVQGKLEIRPHPIAERDSKNPFRYLFWLLSWFGKWIPDRFIPNFLIRLGRTRHYGYTTATHVMDTPFFNSGIAAQLANAMAFGIPIAIGTAITLYCAEKLVEDATKTPSSATGFITGEIFDSGNNVGLGVALELGCDKGSFGRGLGDALLLNGLFSGAAAVTKDALKIAEDDQCRAPFATHTVIRKLER